MSTFTPNLDLELVARNADVGTWDTPTNSNWSLTDLAVGGIANITVNNSNVTLSAAQFQCRMLTFNSTLTGSITISFPSSFTKDYAVQNIATGSSAFTISMSINGSVGQSIVCPPGQTFDIFNDGTNIKFKNLPPVGSYLDYAGASVPAWISFCTVPPYLNCDGTTFSATTYPALAAILGTTTLPDRRGTAGVTLNQGTGRVTTAGSNVDGQTRFSVGGSQFIQSHQHGVSGTTGVENAAHSHTVAIPTGNTTTGGGAFPAAGPITSQQSGTESATHAHSFSVTSDLTGSGTAQNMPPTTITGIVMIRAG